MSSATEDGYIFSRDDRSTIRLNYQHWAIKQTCGYLLHPTIPTSRQSSIRIADIGTGTGIWPLEVSAELPASARLDAFDVSPAQYPVRDWLPPNLHLHTQNAFTPFPEEHIGVYDVVHLRFFVTLVNGDNLAPLIRNLMGLLKPGGYLQWVDADVLSSVAISAKPSTAKAATESLARLMRKPHPDASYDWIPHLGTTLSSSGLEIVSHDRIPVADRYRSIWNQNYLMGYEEYCAGREREHGVEESRRAIGALRDEFRCGVSLDVQFFCVVGRKPL